VHKIHSFGICMLNFAAQLYKHVFMIIQIQVACPLNYAHDYFWTSKLALCIFRLPAFPCCSFFSRSLLLSAPGQTRLFGGY
jgi:hypothetical protein